MNLEEMAKELATLRAEKEMAEEVVSSVNVKIEELQQKILENLESSGLMSAKTPYGTLGKRELLQVASPKTPEQKEAFKGWLTDKFGQEGVNALLTINATTLKSLVKKEFEEREEQGNLDRTIPGVESITTYNTISFRKA